jgi:hypothetical protein
LRHLLLRGDDDDALLVIAAKKKVAQARIDVARTKLDPLAEEVRAIAQKIAKLEAQAIAENARACAPVLAELDRLRAEEVERHQRAVAALDERLGRVRRESVARRALGPYGTAQTKTVEDLTAPAREAGFEAGARANWLLSSAGLAEEDWAATLKREAQWSELNKLIRRSS